MIKFQTFQLGGKPATTADTIRFAVLGGVLAVLALGMLLLTMLAGLIALAVRTALALPGLLLRSFGGTKTAAVRSPRGFQEAGPGPAPPSPPASNGGDPKTIDMQKNASGRWD